MRRILNCNKLSHFEAGEVVARENLQDGDIVLIHGCRHVIARTPFGFMTLTENGVIVPDSGKTSKNDRRIKKIRSYIADKIRLFSDPRDHGEKAALGILCEIDRILKETK
jgi:hypothetical protein